jgi:dihydroorotate dehydrogenase electron transfer subunit
MLQIRAKILYNKRIKDNYFHLVLRAPKIAKESLPGQFLNIKVSDTDEPLLRRPFSIHRVKGANIEILYEVVGEGTKILSQRKAAESLDTIGPLGNGFDYQLPHACRQAGITSYQLPILMGGGMGVAPLLFLAEKLAKRKNIVLLGAKTKNRVLCAKEFKDLGCEVEISTDDGSSGFKGKVTDLLRDILRTTEDRRRSTIYACGPRLMVKEISRISKKHKISAQLSLEEHMACGLGACLGCAVKTKNGFQRVCKEGPVFKADEIIW